MKVCLLAGGTGGAKLAAGFQRVLRGGDLTVITNTGDDFEPWGLYVSPDTDSVLYRLAGLLNEQTGWGVAHETFGALEMLGRYGEETWFGLGDRDLATHVLRTSMLRSGMTLSDATAELAQRLGTSTRVVPMSDDRVRTELDTDRGRLALQEYFVREKTEPRVEAIEFVGLESARPATPAVAAVRDAELVVIGPSNPLISIAPILTLVGPDIVRERTLVVTPIVEGRSLKGPTVDMIVAVGRDPSPQGIARLYREQAGWFVLDSRDAHLGGAIAGLGYSLVVTDTIMFDDAGAERLAASILDAVRVSA